MCALNYEQNDYYSNISEEYANYFLSTPGSLIMSSSDKWSLELP